MEEEEEEEEEEEDDDDDDEWEEERKGEGDERIKKGEEIAIVQGKNFNKRKNFNKWWWRYLKEF